MIKQNNDAREVFRRQGTCSRTFFYLMNREFGNESEIDERAADPLAGGIVAEGHQCGMLWGAILAAGREAARRYAEEPRAVAAAIEVSMQLSGNFAEYAGAIDCRAITGTNFKNPLSMAGYILFKARSCFSLAEEWAPEALRSLEEAFVEQDLTPLDEPQTSCATELLRQVGADSEEALSVAGFAGGLGLSGSGCGALGAALWKRTKAWSARNPGKFAFKNPDAKQLLEAFRRQTGGKLRCSEICGRRFETPEEHSEFIRSGGCKKILDLLASALADNL